MELINNANLSTTELAALAREVSGITLLMEAYGHYRTINKNALPEVIKQDEYSLDVVFARREDLFLVCGTT